MSGKTKSQGVSPEQEFMVTAGVIGLAAVALVIAFMKFLPVLLLAVLPGWVFCDGMRAKTWAKSQVHLEQPSGFGRRVFPSF